MKNHAINPLAELNHAELQQITAIRRCDWNQSDIPFSFGKPKEGIQHRTSYADCFILKCKS